MQHQVKLRFFRDEATGDWGLAHDSTYSDSNSPFNAFWNGIGTFHDVFEHWFEKEHKYFKGEAALNVGGEMTAMGAYFYFVEEMGIYKRTPKNSWYSNGALMRNTTESEVVEAISQGYCNFGYTLESNVPTQRPCNNSELDYQCDELYKNAMKAELPEENEFEYGEYEAAKTYKESVTLSKIRNLHRYGYKMAEKMFPDNWQNRNTLNEFIEYWDNFTANNEAEELANIFKGITITVRKKAGKLSWNAVLEAQPGTGVESLKLKPDYCPLHVMEEIQEIVY